MIKRSELYKGILRYIGEKAIEKVISDKDSEWYGHTLPTVLHKDAESYDFYNNIRLKDIKEALESILGFVEVPSGNCSQEFKRYIEATAEVPLPTNEQLVAFADYIPNAHSWNKSESPLDGFIFVLDPSPKDSESLKPGRYFSEMDIDVDEFGHISYASLMSYESDKWVINRPKLYIHDNEKEIVVDVPQEMIALARPSAPGPDIRREELAEQLFEMRSLVRKGRELYLPK